MSKIEKSGGSRLLEMKAKFQQRQLQEREMKIASLYEAQQARALDRVRHSPGATSLAKSGSSPDTQPTVPVQPGKVRQMFEERRTKAGIDKSYPLQPISNNNNKPAKKPLTNGHAKPSIATNGHTKAAAATNGYRNSSNSNIGVKVKESTSSLQNGLKYNTNSKVSVTSIDHKNVKHKLKVTESITSHHQNGYKNGSSHKIKYKQSNNSIGSRNYNDVDDIIKNHATDFNANHQKRSPSREDGKHDDETDGTNQNYRLEDETFPETMAPTPTPRSPDTSQQPVRPPRRASGPRQEPARSQPSPPPRKTNSNISDNSKSQMKRTPSVLSKNASEKSHLSTNRPASGGGAFKRTTSSYVPATSGSGSAPAGLPCSVCGRNFAPDRLQKHEEICKRAATKKRKPFDVLKHRLAGTEAEPFIGKIRRSKNIVGKGSSTKVEKVLNKDWRQKHQEFIQAIRAAKQVQAHLDAGGKLSDLPPPPPSENPDYVQCPHCKRRFNTCAAERHIPKCATYDFNKPKPNQKKR